MRKAYVLILLVLAACTEDLTEEDKEKALWQIVHYAAKLPPGATHENKFAQEHNEYYQRVVSDYKWLETRRKEGGGYYFLISRPARSRTPMVEGIGGTFRMEKDSLIEYEETFRMWKMPEADLYVKGRAMFERMVAGKDLSIYYPKFTGDQYIEFPNERFVYDKQKRRWRDTTGPNLSE